MAKKSASRPPARRTPRTPAPTAERRAKPQVASDLRRRSRREVEASEERLVFALRAGRLGVFDWDSRSDTVTLGLSDTFEPAVDLPRGIEPRPLPHYFCLRSAEWIMSRYPDDPALSNAAVESVIQGPSDEFRTLRRHCPPGATVCRWVEVHGRVVSRDEAGRALRVVGTFENVTSGLVEEEARRQMELSMTQDTRRTAIAEVGSALAHELNQALTVVMSRIQVASRKAASQTPRARELRKALDDALDFVERGAAIVRRYRRLTQVHATERERLDLAASSRLIVTLLSPDARSGGITLRAVGDEPCQVLADRVQLEQVLLNLVRNALEAAGAAPSPPRRVTVTTRRRGERVRLEVTDTGPGVPADLRASLFTPFVTTKPNGTGLGLSLSRSIVEAHGGRLSLESGEEGRTTFAMELPEASRE